MQIMLSIITRHSCNQCICFCKQTKRWSCLTQTSLYTTTLFMNLFLATCARKSTKMHADIIYINVYHLTKNSSLLMTEGSKLFKTLNGTQNYVIQKFSILILYGKHCLMLCYHTLLRNRYQLMTLIIQMLQTYHTFHFS